MTLLPNRFIGAVSFYILALIVVLSPAIYWGAINALGPSTEYHRPIVVSVSGTPLERLKDGSYLVYPGDRIFVRYFVVRHKINGDCLLNISRYGEYVGGKDDGKRILLDYTEIQFQGANELLRPRWPLNGLSINEQFIPDGQDEQRLALYVVARYRCNPLDWLFPRYLQGGPVPNETARAYITIRRRKQ